MFVLPRNVKFLAYALVLAGAVGLAIGFTQDPVADAGHDAHGHTAVVEHHSDPAAEAHEAQTADTAVASVAENHADTAVVVVSSAEHHGSAEAHHEETATAHGDAHAAHAAHGETEMHDAHHVDQSGNRPWSALLVNSIFFLSLGIGATFFLAIQYAAQVGWSAGLTRVFEAVALWVIVPLLVILVIAIAGVNHVHGVWHWMHEGIMDVNSPNYDEIIAGKSGYLNGPFFIARLVAYIVIWFGGAYLLRKNSLAEDALPKGQNLWNKQRSLSAVFLVLYAVTSSTSAWDIVMSIDAHWYSTLFGWYTFAGMFVTSIVVLNLIVIYLRLGGHLPWINDNHQHDLGKFMFAFSIFWTYLWFSQYMLYANIPEEVTYYMARFGEYKPYLITMVVLNFLVPFLLLVSRDAKRIVGFISLASVFVLVGHWMDHYIMIMPGSVGMSYGFGAAEIGGFLFFAGLFILVVGRNLGAAPLKQQNHPLLKESELFHQ
jgi:hypothetical protein